MTCSNPTSTVPEGGKGQSARCSRVFYLPPDCNDLTLDGTCPSGTPQWFNEQVMRIEIDEKVYVRKYGHDKSYCAQDATTGIISWDATLSTFVQCGTTPFSFRAGQIIWLDVWPLGTGRADARIAGYGVVERSPISMNLENGDPIERNYTIASKGWWDIPEGISGTFDCCNCCEVTAASASADSIFSGLVVPPLEEIATPATVYKWDGSEWVVVLDQAAGMYVPGPVPTDKPKDATDTIRVVNCVLN